MPECFETWLDDAKADDERRMKRSGTPDQEEQAWLGFLAPEDQEEEDWDNWLDYVEFVIRRDLESDATDKPADARYRSAPPPVADPDDDDSEDDDGEA